MNLPPRSLQFSCLDYGHEVLGLGNGRPINLSAAFRLPQLVEHPSLGSQ